MDRYPPTVWEGFEQLERDLNQRGLVGSVEIAHIPGGFRVFSEARTSPWFVSHDVLLTGPVQSVQDISLIRVLDLRVASGGMYYASALAGALGRSRVEVHWTGDTVYRVECSSNGPVSVVCLGIEKVDSRLEPYYHEVNALPTWVKERLAVLMICDSTPPTHEIEGVGRRISKNVFWLYEPQSPLCGDGASTQ